MNTELPRRYVLDSYALLVLLHEESGANQDVERMIRDAKQGRTLLWPPLSSGKHLLPLPIALQLQQLLLTKPS